MGTKPITPRLAADVIIGSKDGLSIVMIERKYAPFGWALPGGFVDVGETIETAAVREAKEEVQLDVSLVDLLYIYSDPARDFRGHTATAIFVASAEGDPAAADDAKHAQWVRLDALPTPIAFDHTEVIADYVGYLKGQVVKPKTN
jgi:8-oxo-dGTP diphosphatase